MSSDNERTYRRERDERTKVNNLIFPSGSGRDFARCPSCLEQFRLELGNSPEGKRTGKCIRGCGQTFELDKTINEETGGTLLAPKKYTSKYGSAGKQHSFIVSQNRKKKDGQLNESDKSDLAALGSSGEGVSKVNEETHTYQDGSWR